MKDFLAAMLPGLANFVAAFAATASAVAAFILVGITRRYTELMGRYTEYTQKMVEEMQEARHAAIRPRLVPVVEYDATGTGSVSVENIGPGPALEAELMLTFEPNGAAYRIKLHLLRAGERRLWNPSRPARQEALPHPYHPDASLPNHTHAHLTGSCVDLLGKQHAVDERIPVLSGWETRIMGVWRRLGEGPPEQ